MLTGEDVVNRAMKESGVECDEKQNSKRKRVEQIKRESKTVVEKKAVGEDQKKPVSEDETWFDVATRIAEADKPWYDQHPWSSEGPKGLLKPLLPWERYNVETGRVIRVGGIFGAMIKEHEIKRGREMWYNKFPWCSENDAVTPLDANQRRCVLTGAVIVIDEQVEMERKRSAAGKEEEGRPWYNKYPFTSQNDPAAMSPLLPWQRCCVLTEKIVTADELWKEQEKKMENARKKKEEQEMEALKKRTKGKKEEEEKKEAKEKRKRKRKDQKEQSKKMFKEYRESVNRQAKKTQEEKEEEKEKNVNETTKRMYKGYRESIEAYQKKKRKEEERAKIVSQWKGGFRPMKFKSGGFKSPQATNFSPIFPKPPPSTEPILAQSATNPTIVQSTTTPVVTDSHGTQTTVIEEAYGKQWRKLDHCPDGKPGCEVLHWELVTDEPKPPMQPRTPKGREMNQYSDITPLDPDRTTELSEQRPEGLLHTPTEEEMAVIAEGRERLAAKRAKTLNQRGMRALHHCFWGLILEAIRESVVLYCKSVCLGCRAATWIPHDDCEKEMIKVWREKHQDVLRGVDTKELENQWLKVIARLELDANKVLKEFCQPSPHFVVNQWKRECVRKTRDPSEGEKGLEMMWCELEHRLEVFAHTFRVSDMFFDEGMRDGVPNNWM